MDTPLLQPGGVTITTGVLEINKKVHAIKKQGGVLHINKTKQPDMWLLIIKKTNKYRIYSTLDDHKQLEVQ